MTKKKIPIEEWQELGPKKLDSYSDDEKEISDWLSKSHLTQKDEKFVDEIKDEVEILDLINGIRIKTNSYIGVAEFENFVVSIFPKSSIEEKNLPRLIEYAFDLKNIHIKEKELIFESESELLIQIITIFFVKQCEIILKHGLFKTYVLEENNLTYLKGKLLIQKQILNNLKYNLKFACRYNELEYDNIENQILLYTLRCAYKLNKNSEWRKSIRKLIYQFSSVVNDVPIVKDDIERVTYDRFNNHYQNAHELSELILSSLGISDIYSPAKNAKIGKSFFVNMNKLFEKFLERLLQEHFRPPNDQWIVTKHPRQIAWKAEIGPDIDIDPDILLKNSQSGEKIIIDAKYKRMISNSDRYQFAFYLSEHDSNRGIAILPQYPNTKNNRFTSDKREIIIDEKRIDINQIIELIFNDSQETEKELQTKINEILN